MALAEAAFRGDVTQLLACLSEHHSYDEVNAVVWCDKWKGTALDMACRLNHTHIVSILLQVFDIDIACGMPLVFAAKYGAYDCMQLLLAECDKPWFVNGSAEAHPLLQATIAGHTRCVELLLSFGAACTYVPDGQEETSDNPSMYPCVLQAACTHGRSDIVRMMLTQYRRRQRTQPLSILREAIWSATQFDHDQCLKLTLVKVEHNDLVITELVATAADFNSVRCLTYLLDTFNLPLLPASVYGAAVSNSVQALRILLQYDCNSRLVNSVNRSDCHMTPLMCAVRENAEDCIVELLQCQDVRLDCKTKNNWTAAHIAVSRRNPKVLAMLVARSVEQGTTDMFQGVATLALRRGYKRCIGVMFKHAVKYLDVPSLIFAAADVSNDHTFGLRQVLQCSTELTLTRCLRSRNRRGDTALHVAVANKNWRCARLLLAQYAQCECTPPNIGLQPHQELSLVMRVVCAGRAKLLCSILNLHVGDMTALLREQSTTRRMTAAMLAVQRGHIECLDVMYTFARMSSVALALDLQDNQGRTALQLAREADDVDMVSWMLSAMFAAVWSDAESICTAAAA